VLQDQLALLALDVGERIEVVVLVGPASRHRNSVLWPHARCPDGALTFLEV
jgi:hypothetical protein